ncbi:MAG: hypothetical protein IJS37_01910 [Bacilli bacterium]|nr:hypothetical protein [Bacilli bacterium]
MNKRLGTTLLILLGLCGCNAQTNTNAFPRTDDPDLAYVTRNGDNYGKSGINHNYESMCRPFSKDRLEEALANGRPLFLFLFSDSCSHCREAHNDLTNFFLSSSIEVEGVSFTSVTTPQVAAELTSFIVEYPALEQTITTSFVTPSIFLIKNEQKALNLQFLEQRESLQNLFDFFKGFMNFTYVYTFHSYDSFASFYKDNDCLVYVDDESDEPKTPFYDILYPEAIHSDKFTAHIEWEYVSEEDRAKFSALLPGKVYEAKKGELSPIPSSTITPEWAKAYYR